ncbi:bifunctional 4-hydroxy-2-oxoglutarate aldolase/2-dehydro-3-deoxy-phosphogluconate aldolase [Marinospirillum perlucidum]|uniref:bifunctional 4-hydroxy-2-oxoglutarate aldolase/2-dehydro-3-deoxy-phosphogluconate aldolase n=1 Tax=Marinospirillum perlucidum TaxID=1982602 RepID=UPI000DF2E633|nr:bifunctional 4-hydroxy-2-oxoglutarate aldolase/2-dehydro-3-deoxy-phosphogluconate aldolase [Marinospirillum perlucidum]
MAQVSPFDWASLLADQPLLPVAAGLKAEQVLPVADSLTAAGVGVLEVTLRDPGAWDALEQLKQHSITRVAGSVRSREQLKRLHDLGITLAVTPGWSPSLCEASRSLGIRLLPGVATPGEAMQAYQKGYHQVKLFPAAALGGPAYLKAIQAPLPEMQFVPTGGVSEANLSEWFAVPGVVAVGGSWMLSAELLQGQKWQELTELTLGAVKLATEHRNTKQD